jgi:hypothetical protein
LEYYEEIKGEPKRELMLSDNDLNNRINNRLTPSPQAQTVLSKLEV